MRATIAPASAPTSPLEISRLRHFPRAAAVRGHEQRAAGGGGIKGGTVFGATDEFGFKAVENPTSVHDLHATILHCLGFDHERLTYRYAGRDFRLTDVSGRVIREIMA